MITSGFAAGSSKLMVARVKVGQPLSSTAYADAISFRRSLVWPRTIVSDLHPQLVSDTLDRSFDESARFQRCDPMMNGVLHDGLQEKARDQAL